MLRYNTKCSIGPIFVPDCGEPTPTYLPDRIRITTQPTKLTYNDGEQISLAGAVVKAYLGDDLWTSERYPNGIIPHNELTLDPSTASGGGGGEDYYEIDVSGLGYISPIIANNVGVDDITSYYVDPFEVIYQIDGGPVAVYVFDGVNGGAYYVSNNPFTVYTHRLNGSRAGAFSGRNVGGVYVSSLRWISGMRLVDNKYMASAGQAFSEEDAANVLKNGVPISASDQTITVKWNRPQDARELTDTFEITVNGGEREIYTDGNGLNVLKVYYEHHQYRWTNQPAERIYDTYDGNVALGTYQYFVQEAGTSDGHYETFPVTIRGVNEGSIYITKYNGRVYAKAISGWMRMDMSILLPSPWNVYYAGGAPDGQYIAIGGDTVYLLVGGSDGGISTGAFQRIAWSEYFTDVPESTVDPEGKSGEGLVPVRGGTS